MRPDTRLPHIVRRIGRMALACAIGLLPLAALPLTPASAPASAAAASRTGEDGPRWNELSAAQKIALTPLERGWSSLNAPQKRKWIDIAARLPHLSPEARTRLQTRMVEWAAMTPLQRTQTRLQFKEAEQLAPKERRAQWEAYQALSADQKRQLAGRNTVAAAAASAPRAAERSARAEAPQQKSNIVPNPSLAARPKAVSPVVVQAAPGATTTLLSKRATPPAHHQAGLPKIAGSANFVDPATLLPQRGPQGAAVTAAAASAPLPRP